jgi:hypothetical protein
MIRANQNKEDLSVDEKVASACRDAGEQVILRAEQTGTPVIIWRDGKVVHLSANEVRIEWNKKEVGSG